MQATSNFNTPRFNKQPSKIFTFDNAFRAVVIILVGIVGIIALALSYDALYQMAQKHGHDGWKSYAWPMLIDLPLVVFTVVMLYAQVKQMGRWSIIGLLGLVLSYTGATVYLNYLESDGSIEGVFVRVAAPVGLFVCTEVLRHLLKFEIDQKSKAMTLAQMTAQLETAQTELDRLNVQTEHRRQAAQTELDQLAQQIDRQQAKLADIIDQQKEAQKGHSEGSFLGNVNEMNQARQEQIDQRREQVLVLHGQGMTQKAIADELDVSITTIKRDLKALNGRAT